MSSLINFRRVSFKYSTPDKRKRMKDHILMTIITLGDLLVVINLIVNNYFSDFIIKLPNHCCDEIMAFWIL